MARYIQHIYLNKPDDFVYFIMNDYLQKNQFTLSNWKGEQAYQAGNALTDGYRYLKWSYQNGFLHLEAWLKGNLGGEWDLEGFVGCMMKKPYRESLEQLLVVLQQDIPAPVTQEYSGMPPQMPQSGEAFNGMQNGQPRQVIQVQTVDNSQAAKMALVFGIISLVFCWIPLLAIIFGCVGISRARMGSGSSKDGLAQAGKVCSIIGVILGIVLWVLNFIISMAGIMF